MHIGWFNFWKVTQTVITLPCDECPVVDVDSLVGDVDGLVADVDNSVVDVDVLMLDTSAICRNVVACANANSIIQLKATEITEK